MKAVVAAFNQEKAIVGAFSVITNLRMELFEALEQVDREVMLACVMELMEVLDGDGNGLITREEFIENGLKSGFVLNLMEYFEDVPDPEPEKCKKPRCRKKCRCKPKDEDEDAEDEDESPPNQAEEGLETPGAEDSPDASEP